MDRAYRLDSELQDFRISERYWASKARLKRLLEGIDSGNECRATVYLRPDSLEAHPSKLFLPEAAAENRGILASLVQEVASEAGRWGTGLVLFLSNEKAFAIAPPFPIDRDSFSARADPRRLADLLARKLVVGVILLRLGRYAVGVVQGESLLASKSGSRHVKSRHRAGGSSQRRFQRSRERLVREIFDKTCEVARTVITPFEARLDYVMLGGEHHTLQGFRDRCPYLGKLEAMVLDRTLDVQRPGQEALKGIGQELWKSRVIELSRGMEGPPS